MNKLPATVNQKKTSTPEKAADVSTYNILRQQAFDNSLQANILSTVSSGKLIVANAAACKLLGYSNKELLTKSRSTIFDIREGSFKKMLKQRTAEGKSTAFVTAIKKGGRMFSCEITSAVFMDNEGIEKAITTITDMSQSIRKQKNIDVKKDKIVADNIVLARLKQRKIDIKKEKIVADNIVLAKSKQNDIDTKTKKIVAGNIMLAKSKQKVIDVKKEKIVADNIILAQAKSDARLAENNEWLKYIGKTSYGVMWDWDTVTGSIYVGESIEEVFGYKMRNNTVHYEDFIRCLLPDEKDRVETKLLEALVPPVKSWDDSFMFRCSNGSLAAANCRASIIRNEAGKAIRLIGAIHDVSRLQKLEKQLKDQVTMRDELRNIFQEAARISFDGIWYWNLLTNEFFLGEGFEELLGYAVKNNTGNTTVNWSKYIYPADKKTVEKGIQKAIASGASHWQQTCRFLKADGSIASVFNRASIIRLDDGKPCRMIGALHDLSRQRELEQKLEYEIVIKGKMLTEYAESFKLAFNSSSDVFYNSDLVTNQVIISDGYEKEFGYKITGNMTPVEDWVSQIHPADKTAVIHDYIRMLASKEIEWKCAYRFLRADNSVADVLSSGIILRNATGKAYRMIGSMHDISKEKVLEERLEQEIRLKEKQIADAMEDAKNAERSDIGKELHDNINQLLGASRMYLQMAKRGGTDSEMYINRSSEYTLSAIEEIRKLTRGLITDTIRNLGLATAIENIARDTMEIYPVKIACTLNNFTEKGLNDKFKLNLFRIVQEQLNNILKHAKAASIVISLSQNKKTTSLIIADDGVGFDICKKQEGIGIANIKSRAASYNGIADFDSEPGQGCVLSVVFPLAAELLNKVPV